MSSRCRLALAGCLAVVSLARPVAAQTDDQIVELLDRMETAIATSDADGYRRLLAPDVAAADDLVSDVVAPGVTRAVVRERDRGQLPAVSQSDGQRLMIEVFTEFGRRGQIRTYRLDLRRYLVQGNGGESHWRIVAQQQLATVQGLYRLSLNRARQFAVRNLTITAEDLTLQLPSGSAFGAEVDTGVTGLVLLGSGTMRFAPRPPAERGQVRIFAGSEALETAFSAVFVRVSPFDFDSHMSRGALSEEPVNPRDASRAQEIFDEECPKSFNLDLNDLSRENWSLVPAIGDFLAEVRTRKYHTLTYARSANEAEDITVFDRERHRNIAVYPSVAKLEARGLYYNEDGLADYDILQYDITAALAPEREWIEGRARLRLRVLAFQASTLTFRLNEALAVRAVVADEFGRLLTLRVKRQNSFIVSLPEVLPRDAILTLTVLYGGRLPPSPPDREAIAPGEDQAGASGRTVITESPTIVPESRIVYTNRTWWYPQSEVTDYVTASIQVTVPAEFDVLATGDASPRNPVRVEGSVAGDRARKRFEFTAGQPVRYLALMVTKLAAAGTTTVHVAPPSDTEGPAIGSAPSLASVQPPPNGADGTSSNVGQASAGGVFYDTLELSVVANPRQLGRGRSFLAQADEILGFYSTLLQDAPYPSFTLALVDNDLPGGHSPAYWAMLYQPLPTTPFSWRGDPVNFDSFPQFFIAHELAHQYWGQAVGWKNYHEQWISEGFAQYFAALYSERYKGTAVFRDLLRQMRRSALERSDQGPIYLGYRLGHIQADGRIFRAIIYNKSAMVLHMLRRLVGDEVFFRGLREFYRASRFRKVGTDDLQRTFEAVAERPLGRFFQAWIHESAIPSVTYRYQLEDGQMASQSTMARDDVRETTAVAAAQAVRVVFDQGDQIFDFPVTVTITYRSGEQEEIVVPVAERVVERRIPLRGPMRDLEVNADFSTLARFERK